MSQQYERDDDDTEDGDELIHDGERLHVPMFALDGVQREIACDLHGQALPGERRRLVDAECAARGLDGYSAHQPKLRDKLVLPDFNNPLNVAYPPPATISWAGAFAPALAAMAQRDAFACNANWFEAQQLENEQRRAEAARREERLAQEAAAEKAKYEAALLAADRRRAGLNGG